SGRWIPPHTGGEDQSVAHYDGRHFRRWGGGRPQRHSGCHRRGRRSCDGGRQPLAAHRMAHRGRGGRGGQRHQAGSSTDMGGALMSETPQAAKPAKAKNTIAVLRERHGGMTQDLKDYFKDQQRVRKLLREALKGGAMTIPQLAAACKLETHTTLW